MKTYNIEIKIQGSTRQYITTQATDALAAINSISGIDTRRCCEYVAREVKNETLSMEIETFIRFMTGTHFTQQEYILLK